MSYLSDILVTFACLSAAAYCLVLSRRLRKLANLESGLGKEISELSQKIADTQRQIAAATATASDQPNTDPEAPETTSTRAPEETKETTRFTRPGVPRLASALEPSNLQTVSSRLEAEGNRSVSPEIETRAQRTNADTGRLPSLRKPRHH